MMKVFRFLRALFVVIFPLTYCNAQFSISGLVTDSNNVGVAGVDVFEKNTTRGTTTNADGRFTIVCKDASATLIFSFIGFVTVEQKVDGRAVMNVTLAEDLTTLQTVEVVGSRNLNRSALETTAAVDIIDVKSLVGNSGQLDINQLLQVVAPSFNANQQTGSDAADHIDPASLRGLGPDQTLVLVNGKRRHQSSSVNIYGTRGRGNTGTDMSTIPVAAIERIEVLRDGASAQYGSDAIAGVVNIVLKSGANELTGITSYGVRNASPPSKFDVLRQKKFDGNTVQSTINYGFPLGKKGFANVTSEFLGKDFTNRPTNPERYDVYRRQFGDAAMDNYRCFLNSKIVLDENSEFYVFGGVNFRHGRSYAFSRFAGDASNVDEIYPEGFDPVLNSNISDKSLSFGLRSKVSGWNVDFNNSVGTNRVGFIVDKTVNASLVEKSPTRFRAGGYQLTQNTTSMDFTRYFKNSFEGINVAFGTEYRIENYKIFAGEEASYKNYGVVNTVNGQGYVVPIDTLGRPSGSQGFPGYNPDNELDEFRQNFALYLDNEINFTKAFTVAAAARYEKYSDFGSTLNGKFATRLALSDALAFRASMSSGFRAPSLAQVFYNTTYSDVVNGQVQINLIANNHSTITRALGIPQLRQEKSINLSSGFTFSAGSFSATLDGYYVAVRDRIVLTGNFYNDDDEIGQDLTRLGITAAKFFTNAVNTKSKGADLILSYSIPLQRNSLIFSYAGNFNKMQIDKISVAPKLNGKEDTYFDRREEYFLLASAPTSKMNLAATYKTKSLTIFMRAVRYGSLVIRDYSNEKDEQFNAKATVDITIGHKLTSFLNLSIGASNVLNTYPKQHDASLTESGGVFEAVQMGFSGAFYFSKLTFAF